MPILNNPINPFQRDVEKITNERNTSEDWGLIMELCDRVEIIRGGPKLCLKAIMKRLKHEDPRVAIQAATLLDACVSNCGKPFRLEMASNKFEEAFRKLLAKSHPGVREKLKALLKKWAEGDFKSDPSLMIIPGLYSALLREGTDFSGTGEHVQLFEDDYKHDGVNGARGQPRRPRTPGDAKDQQRGGINILRNGNHKAKNYHHRARMTPKDPTRAAGPSPQKAQEEEELARAIQLSLEEAEGSQKKRSQKGPSVLDIVPLGKEFKEPLKARTLYDFEAAEDNELTLKIGEIVIVTENSDENWWKGSNHRGEGLFPASFVTTDLDKPFKEEKKAQRRSVFFSDSTEVIKMKQQEAEGNYYGYKRTETYREAKLEPVVIDEGQIDQLLMMLHDADTKTSDHDLPELNPTELRVTAMGPLIDQELEGVDRRLAQLTSLSEGLVEAQNLYHHLMQDSANQFASSLQYGQQQQFLEQSPRHLAMQDYGSLPQQLHFLDHNGMAIQISGEDSRLYSTMSPTYLAQQSIAYTPTMATPGTNGIDVAAVMATSPPQNGYIYPEGVTHQQDVDQQLLPPRMEAPLY